MLEPNEAANARVNALLGDPRPTMDLSIRSPLDLVALRARWEEVEACPVVCAKREDGLDHSWAGLDIRTYLRGEQSAGRLSAHSVKLAPGAAIATHYFDDVETFIMVVEGTPELQVGDLVEASDRYSIAYAPARTRVAFRNKSDVSAWLNIIYFKAGMERAFAEAHDHWQQTQSQDMSSYVDILSRHGFQFGDQPLENDGRTNAIICPVEFEFGAEANIEALRQRLYERPAVPRLVHTSEAEVATDGPDSGFRKRVLSSDESGGSAMINFVARIPPAPKHYQPTEEELFFILDGSLAMTCGTASVVLSKGAMAFAPRNCTHAFGPPAPSVDHKFMTFNTPGGHEHAMAELRRRQIVGITDKEYRELSAIGGFIIQ